MKVTSIYDDRLANILFGKARRAILSLLYMHTDEQYYLRRIVRETGIGLGPAQRELSQLTSASMITREVRDRLVYYRANPDCPIYNELKNIMIKTAGLADVVRHALEPVADRIKSAFIYGSFAQGAEDKHSDIDLMIIGTAQFADISSAISPAQEKLQREINFAVISVHEFKLRLKENDHFIKSVMNSPRISIIGNEDELERLVK